jgi:Tfp pilus assembly protein PilF
MVIRNNKRLWWTLPAATAWLMLCGFLAAQCAADDMFSGAASKPSFSDSIKQGFSKMGEAVSPKPKPKDLPTDDPTLLSSNGKPSIELYLSLAKYYEEGNKPHDAEEQYQKALQEKPDNLVAMLSYAHFMENQGRYDDAVSYYQRAIKAHPKDASVYNNLGLCHARKKKLKEATAALNQATQIDPRSPLYRNNLAALLVEQNRLSEAYEQLRAVHGEAKAYYNLGYLLGKKGDLAAAEHHFKQALLIDPNMQPAAHWLAYLQNKGQPTSVDRNFKVVHPTPQAEIAPPREPAITRILPSSAPSSGPASAPHQNPYVAEQPQTAPVQTFTPEQPPLPDSSVPRRLPPVRQPMGPPELPPAYDSSDTAPTAPLPPGM